MTAAMVTRLLARALAIVALSVGCRGGLDDAHPVRILGADPERGREAMREYGCPSCHVIPGVRGANGTVGPPLTGIASRTYIGGVIENTPENMVRWIIDPQRIDSLSAMPALGVPETRARDMAEYLYTIR